MFMGQAYDYYWVQEFYTLWIPLPSEYVWLIASLSIFLLALTSEGFQWLLLTKPFQFLGQISFTLYLIHFLLVLILEDILITWMAGWMGNSASSFVSLIPMTIVTFLVAWIIQQLIDSKAI
jgi:peptidoglycan/LPS O-acetylase OafA/YrhL